MTFKAYRGGKATDLAKSGVSLGHICNAAEWKESAMAWNRYIDEDKVDPARIIDQMFENSDDTSPISLSFSREPACGPSSLSDSLSCLFTGLLPPFEVPSRPENSFCSRALASF